MTDKPPSFGQDFRPDADGLLVAITGYYLQSPDFNGFPLREVALDRDALVTMLEPLVRAKKISLSLGAPHPNPYIKAFSAPPPARQLDALAATEDLTHVTAYPEPLHLEAVVDRAAYAGRPFALRLALGAGQLEPAFFDLAVLEVYRNDPRYLYQSNDNFGYISALAEPGNVLAMADSDQVVLESFGFAYDDDMHRAVCVFHIYLSRLSPEHQQIWAAREITGGHVMHPAYFASSIIGEFPEKVSIFDAFIEELKQINQMCSKAGVPPLVRSTFADARPANFGFLIRPTLREYQDFQATLDKLMSDNLNRDFFKAFDIELETETARKKDGKIVVTQKGTIQLLADFVARFRTEDRALVDEIPETFREVRKLRQRPAHAADDNKFDSAYPVEQRQLMIRAYQAVRTLRQLMANHPLLADYDLVPDWLFNGEIYDY